jgi:uncharacterized protein (DUF58 family)
MLTRDLLSSVRRIEIRTRRLVNEIFSGQYGSVFRGLGMEFAEVREYVPGDDVRSIDWNVTARVGHPYVKKFIAEREMTVILMVDASGSMRFGTGRQWKAELAAEVAAVLGFSAIRNNDKVGLCLFSDRVEKFIRPQKGRTHTLRLVREVLEFQSKRRPTNFGEALRYLSRVVKRKAVVFLLSDFAPSQDVKEAKTLEKLLAITNKRHDLIALQVRDPREETWPDVGLLHLEDAETGSSLYIDTSDKTGRMRFETRSRDAQKSLTSLFSRHGIDHILLKTDQSFVFPLIQFFKTRVKRFR